MAVLKLCFVYPGFLLLVLLVLVLVLGAGFILVVPASTLVALDAIGVLWALLVVLVLVLVGFWGGLERRLKCKSFGHELLERQLSHGGTEMPAEVHRLHFLHISLLDHGFSHHWLCHCCQF